MAKLSRYGVAGDCYHTISVTRGRKPVFADPANARRLLGAILYDQSARKAYILAYAILPDHLHLLLSPRGDESLSSIMKSTKRYVTKVVNEARGQSGPLWQQSFYDRVIRTEVHFRATIAYIHRNPVEAGLASREEEFPFSSAFPGARTDVEEFFAG